ncbi:DUF6290 family protein [Actinomycetaceae bacterium MB13-C1-2]|nr:DUF6290 family protein [Actinomycetaceae bacterium MB13-C1-2]
MTTTVRLAPDTEARIKRLAHETGRTQSYYINEAIERQLDRLEWEYRILADVEASRAGTLETISHDELKAELGLGN